MGTEVSTERVVNLPVINPSSGRPSRTFRYMGVADRVEGGKLIDWKSCASPAQYINERSIGFQAEMYALALAGDGHEINEIEYRLIKKPTIRLCGKDATTEAYEERCLQWLLEKPENMVSHTSFISSQRMSQAEQFIWDCSKRIIENRNNDRWLPTSKACYAWSRECEFMELCQSVCDSSDTDWVIETNYEEMSDTHPEINVPTTKNILTFSSMSCLCLCNMKYYWKYERGLRRTGQYSDALWIGSAMHVGLDVYGSKGEEAALEAIEGWADENPVMGPGAAEKRAQEVAKARAMVRAAAVKWKL